MIGSNFCKSLVLASKLSNLNNRIGAKRTYHALKVTVCGASGAIGQPLSLLLKRSPLVEELCVYDLYDTCPFASELSQIDTKCKVSAYSSINQLPIALRGSKVVVVVASAISTSSKPFCTMFESNAQIIRELMENFVTHSPKALLAIVTHPVDSLVPLASEILKDYGVYNPKAVFGVTTLNSVRANTFAAKVLGLAPECVSVPVIGGNNERSIVPLLSQTTPCSDFQPLELEDLTKRVQNAHNDILKNKNRSGPTISCAFAAARFVLSLIKGVRMQKNIIECAYVKSIDPRVHFFSTPLLLGPGGIQKNLGIPKDITEFERCQVDNAIEIIKQDIHKGLMYN